MVADDAQTHAFVEPARVDAVEAAVEVEHARASLACQILGGLDQGFPYAARSQWSGDYQGVNRRDGGGFVELAASVHRGQPGETLFGFSDEDDSVWFIRQLVHDVLRRDVVTEFGE